jgi:hypothetical protein
MMRKQAGDFQSWKLPNKKALLRCKIALARREALA